jgi:AcrR family transcriptional regulator
MNDIREKWIHEGYSMLAKEGPNCIQIERLARNIGTNKSSFYHYFVDRDIFFDELIQHHIKKQKSSTVKLIF